MKMEITTETTFLVKPHIPESKGYLPLSEWDQTGNITLVPILYFYRPKRELDGLIETLTDSLSRILVPFYPMAGRLRWAEGSRLLLECNAAGAEFTVAKANCGLDQFQDYTPCPEYELLVPEFDYSRPIEELPLLMIKVVLFKCGGFSLCYAKSHVIADGKSSGHFISEWSRMARGEPIGIPPHFDRGVLAAPTGRNGLHSLHLKEQQMAEFVPPPLLLGQPDSMAEKEKETTLFIVKLTKSQVDRIKDKANQLPPRNGRPYSRYESVAGHMWTSVTKARKHEPNQETALVVSIDFRNKMIPPVRPGFFGNAILDVTARSYSGDLLSKPLGYAASRIRTAIDKVTSDYVWSLAEYYRQQPDWSVFQDLHPPGSADGSFYGNPNLGVVNWFGLNLQGQDFGWGKEAFMTAGNHEFDGDTAILKVPDGSGAIFVSIGLQVRHVDDFKKYFYEDIPQNPKL